MSKHNLNQQVAPTLMSAFGRAGLTFVDVGGRGAPMGQLEELASVAHYVTCEPDSAEASRLAEALTAEATWRGVTVVGEALGSQPGTATLYLTRQPGMSSLLKPDVEVTRHLYLSDKYIVDRTTTVPVVTLDGAAARYGFEDACFVKLDTQGTELDIMQSGDALLRRAILGVHVECSFRPMYTGQPLFGDVDAHLRARGFTLFTLNRVNLRRAGYREQYYSKRLTGWAQCLYLREPDDLSEQRLGAVLVRLLALAMAFQHYDLAFELMQRAMRLELFSADEQRVLGGDVERVIDETSDYLVRKAKKRGLGEPILGAAFRDRQSFE